ncbi:hypothetical protein PRUPE_2G118800 [Prunus persica]|uniref:Uncharacterized protein n=1 Tax=Prunus persica TaxID=3760 RepID=A0A251QEL2_PRUPE|nr:hypothetical protein PRUPE_2G118800 [Prunus persica]
MLTKRFKDSVLLLAMVLKNLFFTCPLSFFWIQSKSTCSSKEGIDGFLAFDCLKYSHAVALLGRKYDVQFMFETFCIWNSIWYV